MFLDLITNKTVCDICFTLGLMSIIWNLIVQFVTNMPSFFVDTKFGEVESKGNRNIISYIYNGNQYKIVVYKPTNVRQINKIKYVTAEAIKKNGDKKNILAELTKYLGPNKDFHQGKIPTTQFLRNSKIVIEVKYNEKNKKIQFNSGEYISLIAIIEKLQNNEIKF